MGVFQTEDPILVSVKNLVAVALGDQVDGIRVPVRVEDVHNVKRNSTSKGESEHLLGPSSVEQGKVGVREKLGRTTVTIFVTVSENYAASGLVSVTSSIDIAVKGGYGSVPEPAARVDSGVAIIFSSSLVKPTS